jgi:hypothetical protein
LSPLFGGTVLFQAAQEPPDFEGGGEEGFVGAEQAVAAPPVQQQIMPPTQDITATPVNNSQLNAITTTAVSPMNFNMAQMVMAPPMPTTPTAAQMAEVAGAGSVLALGFEEFLGEVGHEGVGAHAFVPLGEIGDGGEDRVSAEKFAAADIFLHRGEEGNAGGRQK